MDTDTASVSNLVELGFTQYEARAYVGLLGKEPMTGYALSNATGIPQPKVYETLRRLTRKGIAVAIEGEPAKFVVLPPAQVLWRLDIEFRRRLADAELELMRESQTDGEPQFRFFRSLDKWTEIEHLAIELIDSAARHIYVSMNCATPGAIVEALQRADARGVQSDVLYFGAVELDIKNGRSVRHASTDGVVYRHHQARHLAVVVDASQVVWALAESGETWEAITGDDRLVVALVKGYVRHDIYVQQIAQDLGSSLTERYGPGLKDLVRAQRDDESTPKEWSALGTRQFRTA